jgi:hypothetical protein
MPDAVMLAIALAAPTTPQAFKDTFALHVGGLPVVSGVSQAAFKQVRCPQSPSVDSDEVPARCTSLCLAG